MKKIILAFFIFILSFGSVFAKNQNKDYTLNFNGSKFHLLYSVKNKEFGGYLNEYYKNGDTYNIWTELVAVHHFPNAYSPIDRIKDFKDYLGSMQVPSSLTFDDKKNAAMIDFIMISDKQMPIVLEFNVFKYEKSKKCGSVAVQYAKRYSATTTMQIEEVKQDFEKNRKRIITKLKHFKIPELVTYDIDKCISATQIIEENTKEEKPETQKSTAKELEETTLEQAESEVIITEDSKEELIETSDDIKTEDIHQEEPKSDNENIKQLDTEFVSAENVEIDKSAGEQEILSAPVPENKTEIQEAKKIKKIKKIKEVSYLYSNDKEQYIATPRTKKELKNEVKQNKKKQKDAQKALKTPYQITNNNSDLIAKPRTAKELKKQTKLKKKQAKERAKKAREALKN